MEHAVFFNTYIAWTRSIVLILSILVVVISLSAYNYNAIPVFSLAEGDATRIAHQGHQAINNMIQDRRLIATLVAAQASIFCPLFLLLSSYNSPTTCYDYLTKSVHTTLSSSVVWRIAIEQFCQFLMPLGLAMSWMFCIAFDRRTEATFADQYMAGLQPSDDSGFALANYLTDNLKYIIITVLLLEVLLIWLSSYKYANILWRSQRQQGIRLGDEELEYACISAMLDIEDDEKAIVVATDEKAHE